MKKVQVKSLATIPGATLEMRLPLEMLYCLPEGSSYSRHNGRLHQDVRIEGDSLVIESSTDSIGREETIYQEEIMKQDAQTIETQYERRSNNVGSVFKWIGIALVLGIIVIIIIKIRKIWNIVF